MIFDIESKKAVIVSSLSKNLWMVALILTFMLAAMSMKLAGIGMAQTDSSGSYGFENETVVLPDIINDTANETIVNDTQIANETIVNENYTNETLALPDIVNDTNSDDVLTNDTELPINKSKFLVSIQTNVSSNMTPSNMDAKVLEGSPNTNYGTTTDLRVQSFSGGFNVRTFISFNLSSIPANATILSANLSLYKYYNLNIASRTYNLHRVNASWQETVITWNNQVSVDGLTTTASVGSTVNTWYTWDVTSDVRGFVNGSYPNYGWRISDSAESSATAYTSDFYSNNYTTDTTLRPQLVIYYSINTPPVMNFSNITSNQYPITSNSTLMGWCNATDADNNNLFYNYQWYKNSALFSSGATSSSYPQGVLVNVANITPTTETYHAPSQTNYYANTTSLNGAWGIVASNGFAYVAGYTGDSLTTFNLSNPAVPVQTNYFTNGSVLDGALGVAVSNGFAYVTGYINKSLTTFNLSNPAVPVQTDYYTNTTSLNGAREVSVSNGFAYVTSGTSSSLTTFNLSNPAVPVQINYYANTTSLNGATGIAVSNGFAYVTSIAGKSLTTFNLSNPAVPVQTNYYTNATSLNSSRGIAVSNGFAYAVSSGGNSLTTFNLSNPAVPVQTNYYTNATSLNQPWVIVASNNFVYVTGYTGDSLTTFNLSNPAVPIQINYQTNATSLDGSLGVAVSNGFVYVTGFDGKSLTTFNLSDFSPTFAVGNNWTMSCQANDGYDVSSWLNSSQISITAAETTPVVTLVSPNNGNVTSNNYVNFICNATDDYKLANITFYWNYSGSFVANGTTNVSGVFNQTSFNRTDLNNGAILWNCLACDNSSQCSFAGANWTVNVTVLSTIPTLTFLLQDPADISTTNAFARGVNVTYNITSPSGINASTVYIYYKTNSTSSDTFIYRNGTSITGYQQKIGVNASTNWTFTLNDNEVYPGTYNYDELTLENTSHLSYALGGNNDYLKIRLFNVSNTKQYSFFEVMAYNVSANSGNLRVYYCNSTYTTENPSTASICTNFYSMATSQLYNHTHTSYSSHHVIPFAINTTTGQIGNVKVTGNSYFLLRGATPSSWNVSYISNVSRADTIQTTLNAGGAWTNLSGTVDSHLHQYDSTEILYYYVCANITLDGGNCSSVRSDSLNLSGLPPTPPNVYNPTTGIYRDGIAINYTASLSPNGYAINYYNISLVLPNYTFVKIIQTNNSVNLSYFWNSTGTSDGEYKIRVEAKDNLSQSSFGYSENFTIDNTYPTINFTSPTETSGTTPTARSNILVNVTANDTNLQAIRIYLYNSTRGIINSTSITTTSPNFINFTNLANGLYFFNASANDTVGNTNWTETRNVTILYDITNPLVLITYPANTTYNINVSVLNYTYSDANPGYCWYSRNSSTNSSAVAAGINFTNVTSIEGSNTWTLYCNDTAGNGNSSSITFSKDTIAPTIVIVSPANTTYNNRTQLVNISSNGNTIWFYNGTANETYTTSVYRTFVEGSNTIIAYANDTYGNFNSTSVVFSIDTTPPYIAFISPINGALYNTTQVLINITNSSSQAVWWFNETANLTYTVAVYKNFSDQTTHTIYAYANDSAGNVNATSVTFTINTSVTDLTPPSFNTSNTRPQPGSQYNQTNTVILVVNPSENSTVTANISWDAISQIVSLIYNRTNWYYNNTFANTTYPGVYTIVINATDTFGNSNTTTTNFTIRDITTPSVTNIQPVAGTNYNQSQTVNITANVTDSYYDSVQAVIARVTYPNGTSVNYTLTEIDDTQIFDNIIFTNAIQTGRYNITIIANDTSGNVNNTGTSWFNVNDVTAPQITVLSPASQIYNISSINFSIASNENLSACKFTLNDWLTNYTMQLNASKTGANYTNSSIADGSYTSRFWCNDTSGNVNNTEQVSFSKDTAKPLISITYPQNMTYNTDISRLNYTVSDANLQACWYSTNNGQANTTITCGTNVTGLTSTEGSNTWVVWANDTAGNTNSSSVTFSKDTIPPNITSTLISPYDPAVAYNITLNATATDNIGISGIFVNITLPNTTVITRTLPMANYTIQTAGRHNITFWANDTGGNIGTATDYFIAGISRVNVQFNVINNDSAGLPANLTIYFTGTDKTVYGHNFTGIYLDEHTTLFYDLLFGALDGNISVRLNEVNLSLDSNRTIGLDRLTGLTGYLVTYGINSTYNFTNATIVLSYAGTGYTNENYLGLYRCSSWDFATRTCSGTWVSVTGTQDKTAKTFTLTTTGFSGYAVKQESVPPTPPGPEGPGGGAGKGITFYKFNISITGNCTGKDVTLKAINQISNKTNMSGVHVTVTYGSKALVLLTNDEGIATFMPSAAGIYTIEFKKEGYPTITMNYTIYSCIAAEEEKPISKYVPEISEIYEKAKKPVFVTLAIILSILFILFIIIKVFRMRKLEGEFHHEFVKIRRWENGIIRENEKED